jgi:MoxR-like ATPase
VALVGGGHVLLEGQPGLGKTVLVRSLARVLDLDFARVQFTPDLMPADVTGTHIVTEDEDGHRRFEFQPGPLFTNLLLADEINRATPKTQSALLEAMQEHQVTVEGRAQPLPPPFFVLATQNPIEYEGTYPLPEAQLDRFLLRMGVGYPSREEEWEVLQRRVQRRSDEAELAPRASGDDLTRMQRAVERVHVHESVGLYIVDLVKATRASSRVQVGASPRGSLALLKLGRAGAALKGRDFVTPEDVKEVAVAGLAHRLTLRPELWVERVRGEDVVRECLEAVPTPRAEYSELKPPRA